MTDPDTLRIEIQERMIAKLTPTVQRIFGVAEPFLAAHLLRRFFFEAGVFIVPEPGLVLRSGHVVTDADIDALTRQAGGGFWS